VGIAAFGYHFPMRAILLFLILLLGVAPAAGEEWTSRSGGCFEWQGLWRVERDPSGAWVGSFDLQQVGGPCAPPDNSILTGEVSAAIVGQDFFARLNIIGAPGPCLVHGRVQGSDVRGFLLCQGVPQSLGFALRLNRG
jgi:hypothetical protein